MAEVCDLRMFLVIFITIVSFTCSLSRSICLVILSSAAIKALTELCISCSPDSSLQGLMYHFNERKNDEDDDDEFYTALTRHKSDGSRGR